MVLKLVDNTAPERLQFKVGADLAAQIPPIEVPSMSSVKCKNCSLINFSSEETCRRCGEPFANAAGKKQQDGKKGGFSIYSLVFVVIAAAIGYYAYFGIQSNVVQINSNEANRVAQQKKDPTAGMSRTQYEKHRTGTYGNAMSNNPSFQAKRKQEEETQKVMQAVSNSNPR